MNYLEKLLQGAEVEWKTLGEVAKISSGGTPRTGVQEFYNGDIPWLRTQEVDFNYISDTKIKITEAGLKSSSAKWIPQNCVILAMYGATVGKVAINEIPLTTNQACANIEVNKEVLNHKYLFYCLANKYEYIKSLGSGSQTNINAQIVKNLEIPIPPLSVQKEIVRILDALTAMTAELTAELNLRQKQYQHYRDKLLTFGDEVEWKTLGEVTSSIQNIKWQDNVQSYRYIDLTSVDRENHCILETTEITALNAPSRAQKLVKKDDVIFATTRPTQQRFTIINEEYDGQIASTGYCVLRAKKEANILPKWIYYQISTVSFKNYTEEHQSGSAYPAISDTKVKEFKIPAPSPETQAKIIAILDKFETLTNSITEDLPKEIELRTKQYEYYREILLGFKKQAA